MEQQEPWGQLPQTVLPKLAPQLPSVVALPVGCAADVVGLPSTGSPDVVVDGGREAAPPLADSVVVGAESLQPFWQPLATKQ